jgi:hypothetical protein
MKLNGRMLGNDTDDVKKGHVGSHPCLRDVPER